MNPIFVKFFLHVNWSKYNLSLKFDPPQRIQIFSGINFKVKNISEMIWTQKQAGTEFIYHLLLVLCF